MHSSSCQDTPANRPGRHRPTSFPGRTASVLGSEDVQHDIAEILQDPGGRAVPSVARRREPSAERTRLTSSAMARICRALVAVRQHEEVEDRRDTRSGRGRACRGPDIRRQSGHTDRPDGCSRRAGRRSRRCEADC